MSGIFCGDDGILMSSNWRGAALSASGESSSAPSKAQRRQTPPGAFSGIAAPQRGHCRGSRLSDSIPKPDSNISGSLEQSKTISQFPPASHRFIGPPLLRRPIHSDRFSRYLRIMVLLFTELRTARTGTRSGWRRSLRRQCGKKFGRWTRPPDMSNTVGLGGHQAVSDAISMSSNATLLHNNQWPGE